MDSTVNPRTHLEVRADDLKSFVVIPPFPGGVVGEGDHRPWAISLPPGDPPVGVGLRPSLDSGCPRIFPATNLPPSHRYRRPGGRVDLSGTESSPPGFLPLRGVRRPSDPVPSPTYLRRGEPPVRTWVQRGPPASSPLLARGRGFTPLRPQDMRRREPQVRTRRTSRAPGTTPRHLMGGCAAFVAAHPPCCSLLVRGTLTPRAPPPPRFHSVRGTPPRRMTTPSRRMTTPSRSPPPEGPPRRTHMMTGTSW